MALFQLQLLFLHRCLHRRGGEPWRGALCRPRGSLSWGTVSCTPAPSISPDSQSCSSAQGAPPGSPLPAPQKPEQVWGSPHWPSASLATFFPLLVSGVSQTVSLYVVFALIIGGGREIQFLLPHLIWKWSQCAFFKFLVLCWFPGVCY